jgi:hypothetical protein
MINIYHLKHHSRSYHTPKYSRTEGVEREMRKDRKRNATDNPSMPANEY